MNPSDYNLLATQRPEGLDGATYYVWMKKDGEDAIEGQSWAAVAD